MSPMLAARLSVRQLVRADEARAKTRGERGPMLGAVPKVRGPRGAGHWKPVPLGEFADAVDRPARAILGILLIPTVPELDQG